MGNTDNSQQVGVQSVAPGSDTSDVILVGRAQRGDKDAYRILVERYQHRIYTLALRILRDPVEAEDVAQEAFVKAYLSLKHFKGDSSFITWLYRITHNMAIDVQRKVVRRGDNTHVRLDEPVVGERSVQEVAVASSEGALGTDPERAYITQELSVALGDALGELTEEHRHVVMLREVDGLSYDEIAQVTGISKGTVMSRLFYARQRLQNSLRRLGFWGDGGSGGEVPSGGKILLAGE